MALMVVVVVIAMGRARDIFPGRRLGRIGSGVVEGVPDGRPGSCRSQITDTPADREEKLPPAGGLGVSTRACSRGYTSSTMISLLRQPVATAMALMVVVTR